jgi:hypothetical protein
MAGPGVHRGDGTVTSARDAPAEVKDTLWSALRFLIDGLWTVGLFAGLFVIFWFLAWAALLPIAAHDFGPTWLAVVVLCVSAVALGFAMYPLFAERRRKVFFRWIARNGVLGWLGPVLAGILAFLFATSVFALLTLLLLDAGLVHLSVPGCANCHIGTDRVMAFYIWGFVDAIPLLNLPESLHWNVPLTYSGALMGWLVLAFKVAVIIPLIQAIRTYMEVRRETPRIHLRPWAWRRAIRVDEAVWINWAWAPPPEGYVFDVGVSRPPGSPWPVEDVSETWITDTTDTGDTYTDLSAAGPYRFTVTCRDATSTNTEVTSFRLKVVVRQPTDRKRTPPETGAGDAAVTPAGDAPAEEATDPGHDRDLHAGHVQETAGSDLPRP